MDFYEVVNKRKSVRKYKPQKVPEDSLKRILEAARIAPSWANKQCWKYVVVDDPAIIQSITSGLAKTFGAPVYIVACADPSRSGHKNGMDYYLVDIGISLEHLVLAAAAEGLGTCWLGGMLDEPAVKRALNVPDSMKVVAMTPLGYPEESAIKGLVGNAMRAVTGAGSRMPLDEIAFRNKFGEPYK
jgi:nitroreductase